MAPLSLTVCAAACDQTTLQITWCYWCSRPQSHCYLHVLHNARSHTAGMVLAGLRSFVSSFLCFCSPLFPLLLLILFFFSSQPSFLLCSSAPSLWLSSSLFHLIFLLSPAHLSKSVLPLTTSYQKWRSLSILNVPLQILIFFRLMSSSPLLMPSAFSYLAPRCLSACTDIETHWEGCTCTHRFFIYLCMLETGFSDLIIHRLPKNFKLKFIVLQNVRL